MSMITCQYMYFDVSQYENTEPYLAKHLTLLLVSVYTSLYNFSVAHIDGTVIEDVKLPHCSVFQQIFYQCLSKTYINYSTAFALCNRNYSEQAYFP